MVRFTISLDQQLAAACDGLIRQCGVRHGLLNLISVEWNWAARTATMAAGILT